MLPTKQFRTSLHTGDRQFTSKFRLYWRKAQGCYREFGLLETTRRTVRELTRPLRVSLDRLDISPISENLAVGAAPRSREAIKRLRYLGFNKVVDLRAERKKSDILANTKDILVRWVPTYDDWRPKPSEFYRRIAVEVDKILLSEDGGRLLLCCGAGEHRAPLAGVMALVHMGYSLEFAVEIIQQARPVAELLPIYRASLIEYLSKQKDDTTSMQSF